MKKSFVLYKDSFEYLKELSDTDFGILMKFVFEYAITKNEMPKTHSLYLAFAPIKLQLDRDEEKYKTTSETNKINGSKGGKRKVANATKRKRSQTNLADNDNDNDSDTDSDSDNVKDIDNEIVSKINPDKLSYFFAWAEYRRGTKKPLTNSATLMRLVKRFNSEPAWKCDQVVNASIENGWQGLFWDRYVTPSNPNPSKYVSQFNDVTW